MSGVLTESQLEIATATNDICKQALTKSTLTAWTLKTNGPPWLKGQAQSNIEKEKMPQK